MIDHQIALRETITKLCIHFYVGKNICCVFLEGEMWRKEFMSMTASQTFPRFITRFQV